MRRHDREVTDFEDLLDIIKKCDVCRLALNDEGYPYILPLNFGYEVKEGVLELYFHGALEGTKYALMERDPRASFELDCCHSLKYDAERKHCTMEYESVIGRGHIEFIPDEQKFSTLCIIMRQYHEDPTAFNPAAMPRTRVFKLVVESITGKVKRKPAVSNG